MKNIESKIGSKIKSSARKLLTDDRGWFLKVIDGNEKNNPFPCEVYITSAKPGESKGGHYHLRAQEWFTLIKGDALLSIIDIVTLEMTKIKLSDATPETIYMPPGIAHSFLNAGDEDFILLAFTDCKYQPEDTIIFNF